MLQQQRKYSRLNEDHHLSFQNGFFFVFFLFSKSTWQERVVSFFSLFGCYLILSFFFCCLLNRIFSVYVKLSFFVLHGALITSSSYSYLGDALNDDEYFHFFLF